MIARKNTLMNLTRGDIDKLSGYMALLSLHRGEARAAYDAVATV